MSIPILLTFDAGPHNQPDGANRTAKVLSVLAEKSITGCFFVQTHAVAKTGEALRMNSANGFIQAKSAHEAGHVLGVLTGSTRDYESHVSRSMSSSSLPSDGNNGLESDLHRAKESIESITGRPTIYVRAPGGSGSRSAKTEVAYRAKDLKYVSFNLDSFDDQFDTNTAPSIERQKSIVLSRFDEPLRKLLATTRFVVIRFRDISRVTAANLEQFLDKIQNTASAVGSDVKFVSTQNGALQILERMSILANQTAILTKTILRR